MATHSKKRGLCHCMVLASFLLAVALCACAKPYTYSVGVKNVTDEDFSDVTYSLRPKGNCSAGWLMKGQAKYYNMVTWPAPTLINIDFTDSHGAKHHLEQAMNLPPHFSGEITVLISKTQTGYLSAAVVNLDGR